MRRAMASLTGASKLLRHIILLHGLPPKRMRHTVSYNNEYNIERLRGVTQLLS